MSCLINVRFRCFSNIFALSIFIKFVTIYFNSDDQRIPVHGFLSDSEVRNTGGWVASLVALCIMKLSYLAVSERQLILLLLSATLRLTTFITPSPKSCGAGVNYLLPTNQVCPTFFICFDWFDKKRWSLNTLTLLQPAGLNAIGVLHLNTSNVS